MTNTSKGEASSDRKLEANLATPEEVKKALSAILLSPPFRSSLQIQKVLKFLVLETLAGRGDTLKERNIGARLFERPPDYDTNSDPIVRLRVAEVRKRLALFYQAARDQTVLIHIPSGSFRAVFESSGRDSLPHPADLLERPAPTQQGAEPENLRSEDEIGVASNMAPSPARLGSRRSWIMIAAVVCVVTVIASLRYFPNPEERAFNKFWSPVVDSSNTVLIGMGNNPLYELSNAGEDEYYKNHPKTRFEEMGLHPYIPLSPGTSIDSKYINPAVNTYLTTGDVAALSDIEYVLAQRRIKLDMRFVNDVTYGDLRQNPTILIGAHNNIWTLNMTENLRFGFQGHSTIIDRFDPHRQWTANVDRSETYGIVARVLNGWNGKITVVVGGVGSAATRAVGDFIANPQSISKMAKSLPQDWEKKNLEVVLHTTVKNQIPMAPEVVATYSW